MLFKGHSIEHVSAKHGWRCSCGVTGREDNETSVAMAIAAHLEEVI